MDPVHTFKTHPVLEAERLWMREASKPGFDVRNAKIDLHGQLPRGFTPDRIDPRLYAGGEVTAVGLWHVDPKHPVLAAMDAAIRDVKQRILAKHYVSFIEASEIATATRASSDAIRRALFLLKELGHFYDEFASPLPESGLKGIASIGLIDHGSFDDYLHYENLDDLLERFYVRRGAALGISSDAGSAGRDAADTDEAKRAVYAAIERCVESNGRAYRGNVPLIAEKILLEKSRGRLSTSKANELVLSAIASLANEHKIDAPLEGYREWTILEPLPPASEPAAAIEPVASSKNVFIVHGHDGKLKAEVADYIRTLGLSPIILHERANKGRTIITKFQEEARGASFAVVLMTPDDHGKASGATALNQRARQNVVFELGFFIGKLGPHKVAALESGNVERPSDLDGVIYISLDKEDWRTKLAIELREAGLEMV